MELRPFSLELGELSQHDIAQAPFFALLASCWALYSAGLMALQAKGIDTSKLTDPELARYAEIAFRYCVQWMPDEHPYRREIERYIDEALPHAIEQLKSPPF